MICTALTYVVNPKSSKLVQYVILKICFQCCLGDKSLNFDLILVLL
ncbi:hypothetical protein BN1318_170027 [Staphylococcus capitis]|nr:hypothetical protein BN1318_170027 [Staphylococcus capitis]